MLMLIALPCLVSGLYGIPAPVPNLRQNLSLPTGWRVCVARSLDLPGRGAAWSPTPVPGFLRYNPRGGSNVAWFSRSLSVPASWQGRRVALRLEAARYVPTVYLDGKLVASRIDGWSPFEVDLSGVAVPGKTHQLMVRCQDYGGLFPEGFVWDGQKGNEAIIGKVLAPYGGFKDQMGLIGPATLRSYPQTRILDGSVAITTSVRKGTLTVTGESSSAGSRVLAEVWDGTKKVLALPAALGAKWTISGKADLKHWSPEDPHLYQLRLRLLDRAGRQIDETKVRFGFREFWSKGLDFYLNGVKRHLLGAATWPVQSWLDPKTIRERLLAVKASRANAFRLHIGPWQEEFTQIADEIGLMIVEESAVYTDEGSYAYLDSQFWQNYRDHLKGMFERDRNKPSVVMWSLGNEILFMGNERRDPELPKKLGQLADYVRTIDKTRPVTFEADLDPDGKYDVIGLHYPHELPNVHAYPEAAFWLGSRKETEAAGGMLGQKKASFEWDRKKPLYIGEYLWVPVEDYSPATVFFGDDAYTNREARVTQARAKSWIDQTLAYRRSGVSGLCPWSVFGFGVAAAPQIYLDAQAVFYRHQTAALRSKSLRFYAGQTAKLTFDTFNDTPRPSRFILRAVQGKRVLAAQKAVLDPAGYREITLTIPVPKVANPQPYPVDVQLYADGKLVETNRLKCRVFPAMDLPKLKGASVWVYDPSLRWPGSRKNLPDLSEDTILMIAPGALDTKPRADGLPVVGAGSFDSDRFRRFLDQGGRVLVLEQQTLAPLELGVSLVDHASTMAYSISPGHPVLKGLAPDDLCHWQGGGYVASRQLRRDGSQGLKAIVATGGPNGLAQAPIAEMLAGPGRILFMQTLAGSKRSVEPAAQILLKNALQYLASAPLPNVAKVVVFGEDRSLKSALDSINIRYQENAGTMNGCSGLVMAGDGSGAEILVKEAVERGLPIYWRRPSGATFERLKSTLGAEGLGLAPGGFGPALESRNSPLLAGVSREDLMFTTEPQGWDKKISYLSSVVKQALMPSQASKEWRRVGVDSLRSVVGRAERWKGESCLSLDRLGSVDFDVETQEKSSRLLTLRTSGTPDFGGNPIVEIRVNGCSAAWCEIQPGWREWSIPLSLPQGKTTISLYYVNGPKWGGDRIFRLASVSISEPVTYPAGYEALAGPGAIASWRVGRSTVVVDNIDWQAAGDGARREKRYLSALFQNLGLAFGVPTLDSVMALPLAGFVAQGGQYNTVRDSGIELRSTGYAEAKFACESEGTYELRLRAKSTPAFGEYASAEAYLDGKLVGSLVVDSLSPREFRFRPCLISPGVHTLRIAFPNDASNEKEDRNLFIESIGFARGR